MRRRVLLMVAVLLALSATTMAQSQQVAIGPQVLDAPSASASDPHAILSDTDWRRIEQAVDRGLSYLAARQAADGSFSSKDTGQPAVTSLAVMAFLARGHLPGEGPYGPALDRAVQYVIRCQKPDGLISLLNPGPPDITAEPGQPSVTGAYNHPISGLMLAEVYGMSAGDNAPDVRKAIEQAVQFTLAEQRKPKNPQEKGGWRYLRERYNSQSDMSITSWQLMFLRSTRNAGFEVPVSVIDDAMTYVERCFRPDGSVYYGLHPSNRRWTPAMNGAGVLSMSLAGRHDTARARRTGDFILSRRSEFLQYRNSEFHLYSCFYCSQAMYQLGGEYWAKFFPFVASIVLSRQSADGSYPQDAKCVEWGPCLSTAMATLALETPNGLLPIFQR